MTWIPIPSSNYTAGRQGKKIDRIVLHWIVGTVASADAVFKNPAKQVSAHYAISGTTAHQYVKEEDTAYHAGNWDMNLRSVGIEHEGGPTLPITEGTYKASAKLVSDIAKRHGIPLDRTHVIGHKEVKATQCPGTLDIDRVIRDAKVLSQPTDQQAVIDQLRKERDDNWRLYEAEKKKSDDLRNERDSNWRLYEEEKKRREQLVGAIKEALERLKSANV